MKLKIFALVAAVLGAGFTPAAATAGSVKIDALPYTAGAIPGSGSSADYVNLWNTLASANPTPPGGYLFQTVADWNGGVSNSIAGGVNTNLAYRDTATFTVTAATAGLWTFRTGIDFGYGGTLIVNGVELQTQAHDMWWAGSYSNPSQFLQGSITLGAGTYTLNAYGAEGCCDGGTQGQYLTPGGTVWKDFTTTAVPETSTWTMMLAGFASLGFAGYSRTKKEREAFNA